MGDGFRRRPLRHGPAHGRPGRRRIRHRRRGQRQQGPGRGRRPAAQRHPGQLRHRRPERGKKIFTESKARNQQIKVHDETGKQYGSQGTSTFAGAVNRYRDAYALKTTDGGALVFFSHTHTQTDTVAHSGLQLNPGKDDRAWLHDIPRRSIQYTFVCNDAATVPAKAAPSTLLAYTCARTDASGPPVNSASLPRA